MSDEPIRPFKVETPPKAGLINRLLGRVPREVAFVEIRNILARTPLEKVREGDISAALARANVAPRKATGELRLIFEHAALLASDDEALSETDQQGLSALRRAFQLTDAEANSAIESAVGQIFERTMREALSDGKFTKQEKAGLEATAKALGMSEQQTRWLYESAAVAAVEGALASAIGDRRYTRDEEAQVTALAKSLGVSLMRNDATAGLVAKFKLLAQIDEGLLPSHLVPILLKRGETCHFFGAVTHHQIKTITKRINYSGPAASIRIMKGLRWRFGSIAVQRVATDVMTQLDSGNLYITNTRLLFDGEKKNTSIALIRITNFTVFKDGLQIEKDTGADQYFIGDCDWEIAGACLNSAVRILKEQR